MWKASRERRRRHAADRIDGAVSALSRADEFDEILGTKTRERVRMASACVPLVAAASIASRGALRTYRFRCRAPTRVSRPVNRNGPWVAATATTDDVDLATAKLRSRPLTQALDASRPDSLPPGPAVFAFLDGTGAGAAVTYVGVSKRAAADVADLADQCARKNISASHVCFQRLPPTARKPKLKAALGAWLEQSGPGLPPGNVAGILVGTATGGRGAKQSEEKRSDDASCSTTSSASSSSTSSDAASSKASALRAATSCVTQNVIDDLCEDGFVVLDDVLPNELLQKARESCERLKRDGAMTTVGQVGRDDSIFVLNALSLPDPITGKYGGLAGVAETLLCFPEALRTVSSSGGGSISEKETQKEKASGTRARLRKVSPPARLMVAHYPGDKSGGAKYVPHLDNDPNDDGHDEGTPGLRACDRAVTCILYLNPEWEEKHGGCLRVTLENGKGTYWGFPKSRLSVCRLSARNYSITWPYKTDTFRVTITGQLDVAPTWGRVVLFDSRRMTHEVLPSHNTRFAVTAWFNELAE